MHTKQIEAQITAILKKIQEGKAKNIYAAKNKVKSLKKMLPNTSWNDFLAK